MRVLGYLAGSAAVYVAVACTAGSSGGHSNGPGAAAQAGAQAVAQAGSPALISGAGGLSAAGTGAGLAGLAGLLDPVPDAGAQDAAGAAGGPGVGTGGQAEPGTGGSSGSPNMTTGGQAGNGAAGSAGMGGADITGGRIGFIGGHAGESATEIGGLPGLAGAAGSTAPLGTGGIDTWNGCPGTCAGKLTTTIYLEPGDYLVMDPRIDGYFIVRPTETAESGNQVETVRDIGGVGCYDVRAYRPHSAPRLHLIGVQRPDISVLTPYGDNATLTEFTWMFPYQDASYGFCVRMNNVNNLALAPDAACSAITLETYAENAMLPIASRCEYRTFIDSPDMFGLCFNYDDGGGGCVVYGPPDA